MIDYFICYVTQTGKRAETFDDYVSGQARFSKYSLENYREYLKDHHKADNVTFISITELSND